MFKHTISKLSAPALIHWTGEGEKPREGGETRANAMGQDKTEPLRYAACRATLASLGLDPCHSYPSSTATRPSHSTTSTQSLTGTRFGETMQYRTWTISSRRVPSTQQVYMYVLPGKLECGGQNLKDAIHSFEHVQAQMQHYEGQRRLICRFLIGHITMYRIAGYLPM